MPQIIPIKDLKDTARISEMCHASDEPIYVTKNGYGDMVFMSMETYENMQGMAQIYRDVARAEQDIAEGRVQDAREALTAMRAKYAL
mgnify:CR=1 FL=1